MLKVILLRVEEEKRRAGEIAFFLENTKLIMSRMLVEMWMLKSILVSFQMMMRNIYIIGNRRKGDPCYKMAKNLVEVYSCSTILLKVEFVNCKS